MLFRQAALDHLRRGHAQGQVLLRSPRSFWWMSSAALGLGLAVLALLFLGSYTQRARVSGHLVPDKGLLPLSVQQAGVMAEVLASEGDAVRQGQVLFRLRAERQSLKGELSQQAVRSLQDQRSSLVRELQLLDALAQNQAQALRQRQRELAQALPHAQLEQDLQRRRLQSAQATLQRYEELQRTGFASSLQVQQRLDEVLDQQARLAVLERTGLELKAQLQGLQLDQQTQALRDDGPRAQARRQLAALEQDLAEAEGRREWVLTAPADGTLTSLRAHPGQPVLPGQELALVLPQGSQLLAELQLPSSAAAFVRTGLRVNLRYAAFPYQKFGQQQGVVKELARAAVQVGAAGTAERSYRVLVSLPRQHVTAYGESVPLQPDMQVEADVMLSQRRLIEWIFEPMLALKGRL